MSRIQFEPGGVVVHVDAPARIVDVTDDHGVDVLPYSCRAGHCGTCRVRVLEGSELLRAADDDERDTLDVYGEGPTDRLGCQLWLIKDGEQVILEVAEPD